MRWVWIGVALAACSAKPAESEPAKSAPAAAPIEATPAVAPAREPDRASGFVPPDDKTRFAAVGNLAMLPEHLQLAFSSEEFSPMAAVESGDWLAEHPEPGQTYDQFVAARYQRPTAERRTIYVLQIGALDRRRASALPVLIEFLEAYFQLPVKVMRPVEADDLGARSRPRATGEQLHAGDILSALEQRLPNDAFCLIALTVTDLYPQDDWQFVFGMARLRTRVGVYSFARYHPGFYGAEYAHNRYDTLILDRSLKIMAHEVGHMFGLEHCIYYECVVNGSNSMGETDRRPSHLCPVDLRKLHHSIRFDPKARYEQLERFYRRRGLAGHAAWVRSRRIAIEGVSQMR